MDILLTLPTNIRERWEWPTKKEHLQSATLNDFNIALNSSFAFLEFIPLMLLNLENNNNLTYINSLCKEY